MVASERDANSQATGSGDQLRHSGSRAKSRVAQTSLAPISTPGLHPKKAPQDPKCTPAGNVAAFSWKSANPATVCRNRTAPPDRNCRELLGSGAKISWNPGRPSRESTPCSLSQDEVAPWGTPGAQTPARVVAPVKPVVARGFSLWPAMCPRRRLSTIAVRLGLSSEDTLVRSISCDAFNRSPLHPRGPLYNFLRYGLMHLFMHHGHGERAHEDGSANAKHRASNDDSGGRSSPMSSSGSPLSSTCVGRSRR